MARRKRRRVRRTKSAVAAAPRRRRRRLSTSPRRRTRRRRGLSEFNLVKGKAGQYVNPILEGAMGGVGTQLLVKAIPTTIFTSNPTLAKNENLVKGAILLVGAAVAAHFKQPLVAAGMAGGAAILVMQKEGILQDGMSSTAGRFSPGRFADSRLLSAHTPNRLSPYANYQPLYEQALLSDAYEDMPLQI